MSKKINESFPKGEGTTADDQYYILLGQLEAKYPNSNFKFKKYLEPIFKIAKNEHKFDWCMKDYNRVPIEVLTYYMMEDLTKRAYDRLKVEDERWALGYMRTLEAILNVGVMEDGHREGFRENLDKLATLYQKKFLHKYDGELDRGFCMKDLTDGEPEEGYDEGLSVKLYRDLCEKYGKNRLRLSEETTIHGLTEGISYRWVADELSGGEDEELFELLCGDPSIATTNLIYDFIYEYFYDIITAPELRGESITEFEVVEEGTKLANQIYKTIADTVLTSVREKVLRILDEWKPTLLSDITGSSDNVDSLIGFRDFGDSTQIIFSRKIANQVRSWVNSGEFDSSFGFRNYGDESGFQSCLADSFKNYVVAANKKFNIKTEIGNAFGKAFRNDVDWDKIKDELIEDGYADCVEDISYGSDSMDE